MSADTPAPTRAVDPARAFALQLQAARDPARPLAGRLEHVMSGRCADFDDDAQLVAALRRLAGATSPTPDPTERTNTMTPDTLRLVRDSWARAASAGPAAAALFYEQLFALDPSLRRLFRTPLDEQGARLLQMLGQAVDGLADPARLLPVLRALGARHARYGVQDAHYASVGQALLRTLELALGEGFTPAVRAAWVEVYGLVAQTMREAARQPA